MPVKEAALTLRQETPEDFETVEHITREAFFDVHGPGCCEHYLLHHMRSHADFVPELSTVALINETLAGTRKQAAAMGYPGWLWRTFSGI